MPRIPAWGDAELHELPRMARTNPCGCQPLQWKSIHWKGSFFSGHSTRSCMVSRHCHESQAPTEQRRQRPPLNAFYGMYIVHIHNLACNTSASSIGSRRNSDYSGSSSGGWLARTGYLTYQDVVAGLDPFIKLLCWSNREYNLLLASRARHFLCRNTNCTQSNRAFSKGPFCRARRPSIGCGTQQGRFRLPAWQNSSSAGA